MPNISISVDEEALKKSGLSVEEISAAFQNSIAKSIENLRDYYKKNIIWDIHHKDLVISISDLIGKYVCDVHHGSHPDDPLTHPWDYSTGTLSTREHESFTKIWERLNLRIVNGVAHRKLNTKIKISQFDVDLLLSMIEFFMSSSDKDESFQNDLILVRNSLEEL
jgi:hypothetical protein